MCGEMAEAPSSRNSGLLFPLGTDCDGYSEQDRFRRRSAHCTRRELGTKGMASCSLISTLHKPRPKWTASPPKIWPRRLGSIRPKSSAPWAIQVEPNCRKPNNN
jgi:hypothetical protein